ncbi:sensor domain-containing phosphodiesterase [Aquipuribacter sp. SD81]|uniref:sensor domain-containing phosphodiesterase n=1 Tax=Aquipuribacter sp. SD81 TaxID=3127703 RepID=UPI0030168EAF
MSRVPVHPEEARRLLAVQAQRAVAERCGDDPVLRTLTTMGARLLGVPVATVTLVDETETHVVAARGERRGATRPRVQTMCAWAVAADAALSVPDLAGDSRFRDGDLVAEGLRSYHGVPLHAADGLPLGAFCVFDTSPRHLDASQRELLRELALLAESHLALTLAEDLGGARALLAATSPAVATDVPTQRAPHGPGSAAGSGPRAATEPLDVAGGLAAGEIVPFYQPIVTLADGRTTGVEALVRWEHPTLGLLQPGEFLPEAEQEHLVLAVDALVLEEACHQVQHWRRTRPDTADLELSVNVSGRHLETGSLVELVETALESSGLPAHALTLELTETVLVASGDAGTVAQLQAVRDLGVGLALDDFGTAYSTLTYLRRFPVTRLKVDQSFVRGLGVDRRDGLLVESVVRLARGLGLDVVGEGVETARQASVLRGLGCHRGQGFHFQRPASAEHLEVSGRLGPLAPVPAAVTGPLSPLAFGEDLVAHDPEPDEVRAAS